MKATIISNKESLRKGKYRAASAVHFSFRPSLSDIQTVVSVAPNLKTIHLAPSVGKSIAKKSRAYLANRGIEIVCGLEAWGQKEEFEFWTPGEIVFNAIQTRMTEMIR